MEPIATIEVTRADPEELNNYKGRMNAFFARNCQNLPGEYRPYARQNNVRRAIEIYGAPTAQEFAACFGMIEFEGKVKVSWKAAPLTKEERERKIIEGISEVSGLVVRLTPR